MIGTGILFYKRGVYGWSAVALFFICLVLFLSQGTDLPPGGSTWQGYTLGGVSAALVLWLASMGIRKRYYLANGRLQDWTSAHVYLGLSLVAIVTLHNGAQIGWNIHTLAYLLLIVVVISGMFGMLLYHTLPRRAAENRKGVRREKLFEELRHLNTHCLELCECCSPDTEIAIRSSIYGTVIGGGILDQLLSLDKSTFLLPSDLEEKEEGNVVANPKQTKVLEFVAERAPRVKSKEEADALTELVSVIARRQQLLVRIRKDVQIQGWLRVWRVIHVPVSAALVCAMLIHIIVVFMYW